MMLDHLRARIPDWDESSPVDMGVAIVEVLAYAADYLSYYQDAVATEAYLGTARLRRSVKHHARLLDYHLHEGCNSRVWVQVCVQKNYLVPKRTTLLATTESSFEDTVILQDSVLHAEMMARSPKVFETVHDQYLYPEHNEIHFYAPDNTVIHLNENSTSAVLCGAGIELLLPGQVLILEQTKDPQTNSVQGVDKTRRHAVRIQRVQSEMRGTVPVVVVYWDQEDALPFVLPIAHYNAQGRFLSDLAVARGNIILADYGQTILHEKLPPIPPLPARYRPGLSKTRLTYSVPTSTEPTDLEPAQQSIHQDPREAVAAVSLFQLDRKVRLGSSNSLAHPELRNLSTGLVQAMEISGFKLGPAPEQKLVRRGRLEIRDRARKQYLVASGEPGHTHIESYKKWTLRPDLLSSTPLATDYVIDMEEDGTANLRFGFSGHGRMPQPGDEFYVSYRVGNGAEGNVRAETIAHIVLPVNPAIPPDAILAVRNPLAAEGGTEREPIEEARFYAPLSFRSQMRCVTAQDYVDAAKQLPNVLNAAAQLHGVEKEFTTILYVQRQAPGLVDAPFQARIARAFNELLLAGRRLRISEPVYVPLQIELVIQVGSQYDRARIGNALLQAFSPTAETSFFYPDNLTFAQNIYASRIITLAMAVPGVVQARLAEFRRLDEPPMSSVRPAILIAPIEIARVGHARIVTGKMDENIETNGTILFRLETAQ